MMEDSFFEERVLKYFKRSTTTQDFLHLLAGEHLGSGAYRTVVRCAHDSLHVLKFETEGDAFQNIMEWKLWKEVEGTKFEKWFAPCRGISPNGIVLIQAYARDARKGELPARVPSFFTDLKEDNWGIYKDENGKERPVCRDYGMTLAFQKGLTERTYKANWWGGDPAEEVAL